MENKINIAELLKDCLSGMELDCTIVDGLYFDKVTENNEIKCYSKRFYESTSTCNSICFYSDGSYLNHTKAKCVIFPKGKTTWEGFVPPCKFKDGDIVYTCNDDKDEYIFIFKSITENTHVNSYLYLKGDYLKTIKTWLTNCDNKYLRLATKEEKEKLFDAIKANGYKWNEETKTIEKLVEPKFKVGDVIQDIDTYKVKITEVNIEDECYGYESMIAKGIGSISFSEQDNWELDPKIKPKFKVGDKVRVKNGVSEPRIIDGVFDTFYSLQMLGKIDFTDQDNWELAPNKFDINTLKPFESKVLVRDINTDKWIGAFYSHCKSNGKKFYTIGSSYYYQCIPYEGNEHLLDTNDDCDNFYKTW